MFFVFLLFLRHLVELMPSTWILLWTWMFHAILRHTFTGLAGLADLVSITVTSWLSPPPPPPLWENVFHWPCNKSFTSVHEDWFSISPVGVAINIDVEPFYRDIRLQRRCTTGRNSWMWANAWFAKKKMQIDQRIDALENSYYIWFLLTLVNC